jgi:hypothetical protein
VARWHRTIRKQLLVSQPAATLPSTAGVLRSLAPAGNVDVAELQKLVAPPDARHISEQKYLKPSSRQ